MQDEEQDLDAIRLAGNSDIEGLFKFRPYHDKHRTRVKSVLLDNKIYFSLAASFNDPFDPRPYFTYESVERFQYHALRRINIDEEDAERREIKRRQVLSLSKPQIDEHYRQVTRDYYERLRNEYPMYCLSATRQNILQWSHYANGHQGLCIHFDHKRYPFAGSMMIDYEDQYPKVYIPRSLQQRWVFRRTLLTKSVDWKYEKEFRLIRFPEGAPGQHSDLGLQWTGHIAQLPPGCVTGITLGAMMSLPDQHELISICRALSDPIPVYKTVLSEQSYSLEFQQVA